MEPDDPGGLRPRIAGAKLAMEGPAWGVGFGVLSVLFWSVYNVGSDIGDGDGFRPVDLVFFRFVGGGLCFLPLVVATGFRYAPLAHAVVIAPDIKGVCSG